MLDRTPTHPLAMHKTLEADSRYSVNFQLSNKFLSDLNKIQMGGPNWIFMHKCMDIK